MLDKVITNVQEDTEKDIQLLKKDKETYQLLNTKNND